MSRAALTVTGLALALTAAVVGLALVGPRPSREASSPAIALEPPPHAAPTQEAAAPAPYLAFARDFTDFRSWERIPVEGAMLPVGIEPGPTAIYVNRRPPPGARRWPVGTILVKAIEREDPSEWVIHAMVKRGVPYNRDGTLGWEFLELRLEPETEIPRVVWRGTGPPSGHGYAAQARDAGPGTVALVCNDCHAAAWQSDGALTPALAFAR